MTSLLGEIIAGKAHQSLVGTRWYHVAHPKVLGTVVEFNPATGAGPLMQFEEAVGFSGNAQAGLRTRWVCDPRLLFSDPLEAFNNSWEAADRVREEVSIWDHLNED